MNTHRGGGLFSYMRVRHHERHSYVFIIIFLLVEEREHWWFVEVSSYRRAYDKEGNRSVCA